MERQWLAIKKLAENAGFTPKLCDIASRMQEAAAKKAIADFIRELHVLDEAIVRGSWQYNKDFGEPLQRTIQVALNEYRSSLERSRELHSNFPRI